MKQNFKAEFQEEKEQSVNMILENSGFKRIENKDKYPSLGTLYKVPEKYADGYYWIYEEKDLFNIKIHDFTYHEDTVFKLSSGQWPRCLNITYYESVSGEELTPYRHLTPGCVKTFFGGANEFHCLFHKGIPLVSIGIEIFPAYYEKYLQDMFPDESMDPAKAFHSIDQTLNFPELITLLKQISNYKGKGASAKLFYRAKVTEAISIIMERERKGITEKKALSPEDELLISNVTNYIQDHFNYHISLETLSKISCMGSTKLKKTFKEVHHMSITEYIKEKRLNYAESLLTTTDLTIEQVASSVGYQNSGRFASLFHERCGLYPAEYRRMTK